MMHARRRGAAACGPAIGQLRRVLHRHVGPALEEVGEMSLTEKDFDRIVTEFDKDWAVAA